MTFCIIRRRLQLPPRLSRESPGHGSQIEDSELRKAYDAYDPELASYLAKGIRMFAKSE